MLLQRAPYLTASLSLAQSMGLAFAGGTEIPPYADSISSLYTTEALLSVGDLLPLTSDTSRQFKMIGIPDGLGAYRQWNGDVVAFLSHELTNARESEPILGNPRSRGAFVSRLILGQDGCPISADLAYTEVFLDDIYVGPAARTDNTTPGFGRFCSGSLAGPAEGFDRPIYFANEESGGATTFDGKGGLSVAIFDGEAHGLTALGHFPWENTLVQRNFGPRTVIMGMEDGPASQDPAQPNSQLYMYVGYKDYSSGATVLERNGLVGGTLYVFSSLDPSKNSELNFQSGKIYGRWVAIPDAGAMNDVELEAASDAANAMIFARPEEGVFNPRNKHNYFFVTTGGAAGANSLGRLYSLSLNPFNPTHVAELAIEYNADEIVAAGGDIALSPDNIDASLGYLMIQEDGTTESRLVMGEKGRDGSIWRLSLKGLKGVRLNTARRVVELAPPGRDGIAVGPGVWETSGIIDGTWLFGFDTWLFDVQAHAPTTEPAPFTVEDGQLMLLKPVWHH